MSNHIARGQHTRLGASFEESSVGKLLSRENPTAKSAFRGCRRVGRRQRAKIVSRVTKDEEVNAKEGTKEVGSSSNFLDKLGLSLGPIGLTIGESKNSQSPKDEKVVAAEAGSSKNFLDKLGVSLGPIGLTIGESKTERSNGETSADGEGNFLDKAGLSLGPIGQTIGESSETRQDESEEDDELPQSIAGITKTEWDELYLDETGKASLWLEDDYNAASRLPGARKYGFRENVAWSGEEAAESTAAVHTVKVKDKVTGFEYDIEAPEDRYVLFEAEDQGMVLPNACRHGCCTQCTVKVKSGTITQPAALGLSPTMKEQGYALLCCGFALSDLEVELQDPDEVYDMQWGEVFADRALDKELCERDDFALEIADMDE